MKGLSKSRYTLFCQCPKALWLRTNKPDEAIVDGSTEARFEAGNEVGDLAMGLFGPFEEVTIKRADGSLDLTAMVEKTRVCMADGTEIICEASFTFDNNYCAVDILRKTAGGWAIYEVKSSSFPEFQGEEAKLEKYAPDIAYQKWLLTQCGVNITATYLVCLNSDYVRQGELDIQKLFAVIDMRELVENELAKVPARVAMARELLATKDEPDTDLSEHCMKPYLCGFLPYCRRYHGVPEDQPTVFDLYRMPFSKKLEHYHAGRILFNNVREEKLSDKQQMQVECTLGQTSHIDREGISQFLDTLTYPLYFLDFETMQQAIPQYDGARPYQQITFQYSLHIKESETAPYEHREFLAPSDGSDPRRHLAEQLCKDIPMNVCTLAYNKSFECSRIKELAAFYPDLAVHLMNIRDHIEDLLVPFQSGFYYVPAMHGSFSIKSVLPALFPDEPSLNYHNLDERCQNGGNAMTLFPLIEHMPPEEAAASREALLRYCELDTWAMVKVWEKLKEVIDKELFFHLTLKYMSMVNKIIEAIKDALKANGSTFRTHLSTSKNRKHKTIEEFQESLAEKLSSFCKNNCQERPFINSTTKNKNGCEYPLYENIHKLGTVKDRADIRREILLNNTEYELIIEIDATRADQVAKKMMSRFCYAILNNNKPIIYVALLYQGTKSMNSDECKKYFKMGDEVLRKINSSNILIGYIVDKDEQKDVRYVSECNKSFTFDDEKAFDSDLYRRYLEDHGVQSPASIECYMLPLNTIHKCPSKAIVIQKNIIKSKSFNDYKEKLPEMNKNQLSYWRKYYKYLNDKKIELGLDDENNL